MSAKQYNGLHRVSGYTQSLRFYAYVYLIGVRQTCVIYASKREKNLTIEKPLTKYFSDVESIVDGFAYTIEPYTWSH